MSEKSKRRRREKTRTGGEREKEKKDVYFGGNGREKGGNGKREGFETSQEGQLRERSKARTDVKGAEDLAKRG